MILDLLIFGSKNFNNSFQEIKEDLGFSLLFYNFSENKKANISAPISGVIVDGDVFKSFKNSNLLGEIKQKPILLIQKSKIEIKEYFFSETIYFPISLSELRNKIYNNI